MPGGAAWQPGRFESQRAEQRIYLFSALGRRPSLTSNTSGDDASVGDDSNGGANSTGNGGGDSNML